MDLTRWIVDTMTLEQALDRARARNRRVQLLAAQLEQHGEDVVAAALDALVAALDAAPAAPAAPAARATRAAAPKRTTLLADECDEQKPRKRHRSTKAEFEQAKLRILNALDREGKTARRLAEELGEDYERNALLALLREGRAVAVSRGCYALAS